MKLVHLFGFIIKKFVTMHGHINVKLVQHNLTDTRKYADLIGKLHIFALLRPDEFDETDCGFDWFF